MDAPGPAGWRHCSSRARGGHRPAGEEERFIDDQRKPNLEETDEQQARDFLDELFTDLSAEKEYAQR